MCDPVTASTLMVVAGATQAYGQVEQGRNARDVAEYNARELENQAISTRNKGVEEENIQRRKTAQLQSLQRAQLGAAGVDIDMGSAADIQQDTELLGEVDALRIRTNFEDQATQMERQGALTLQQGKRAERAGYISAAGTLLGSMAGAASVEGGIFSSAGGAGSTGSLAGSPVNAKWYNSSSSFMKPYTSSPIATYA